MRFGRGLACLGRNLLDVHVRNTWRVRGVGEVGRDDEVNARATTSRMIIINWLRRLICFKKLIYDEYMEGINKKGQSFIRIKKIIKGASTTLI